MMLKPWALAILGLLAFAVTVWFAGPLLVIGDQAPLASAEVRLLVIAAFALQYFVQRAVSLWQSRRNNERVVSALIPAPQAGLSEEGELLRERFGEALAQLRRARLGPRGAWKFGRSYLYQLPWYMIIGAPGSGKTTALLNSGLSFPLARKVGRGSVRGFGGTRNCDWWFTDRAVLIDTAGRYTTHESDQKVDRKAWEDFLQLLRAARPRRPLNGVLVAVSVGDLLEFTPDELRVHARTLRDRLDELQSALRVRMPVYVLLTKCDLLPGFVDWFGSYSRAERDQVWGVTFDLRTAESRGASAAAGFAAAFDQLLNRLADRLIGQLQAERDPLRRSRIFALPNQLHALRDRLDYLIQLAFGPSLSAVDYDTLLRGVYLTSGTQHGTPIDRMLFALGSELGLERQILPPNQSTGKSFFLAETLNEVVLAESELDGGAPLRQRKRRFLVAATAACLLPLALVVGVTWLTGYTRTRQQIDQLDSKVARARTAITSIPISAGANPRTLLPALEAVRALRLPPESTNPLADFLAVGTHTRAKLASAAQATYDRMLLGPFQRQIATAIDSTLREGAEPNVQYEALKTYRMLRDPAHFNGNGVRIFVMSYWNSALQPPLSQSERASLSPHLDALLKAGAVGSSVQLEPALVDSVQARLRSQPLAQQITLRLDVLLQSEDAPDFSLSSLGPGVTTLFVGADGSSEPEPVPGRYTLDAYTDVVNKQVAAIGSQLAAESQWVLGVSRVDTEAGAAQVLGSYRSAYTQAWSQLLEELRLKHVTNNQQAMGQARALGEPGGPLTALLGEIVRQTPQRLQDGNAGPIVPSEADRLLAIAKLVLPDANGNSALNAVLESFRDLQSLRSNAARGIDNTSSGPDKLSRIVADAKGEPEPVKSMLLSLATLPNEFGAVTPTRLSGTALSKQVAAKLGVPCLQVVAGHFPFDRRATRDASFDDFARLFAPKGAFDGAFAQLLATRVDTSSDPWRWLPSGVEPPAQELELFRAASRLRDVFFAQPAKQPTLRLTFKPVDMDESIDRFLLEIDGQIVRYAHGPTVPAAINWPGSQGSARIQLTPAAGGEVPTVYTGPWALFRLMDRAAIRDAGTPGHFEVIFDVGGRHATFDVSTDTGANPFRMRELERFECPISGQ